MKHFFALPALLRAATILAYASQHTFSVHDDLLAFPQYEVRLSQKWVSEEDAQERILSNEKLYEQQQQQQQQQQQHEGTQEDSRVEHYEPPSTPPGSPLNADASEQEPETAEYEYMVMDGQRWLCKVPLVHIPEEPAVAVNETSSVAEEEKELARATDRGWELLSGMQDHCVYFISGWWSYRFCYNQGIRQFHQLPPSRGVPTYPPIEDPGVEGFTLGTYAKRAEDDGGLGEDQWEGTDAVDTSEGAKRNRSGYGELVQRGESRYLVQQLGGGTMCDLTGKERRTEVQFHCNPQSADKISLIKETSTCSYLMVIHTPRLCNDVAFLPPQKDRPNPISCSPILAESEVDQYEKDLEAMKAAERDANMWEAKAEAAAAMAGPAFPPSMQIVGDILVGGYTLVPPGKEIEKSAIVGGGKETYVDTIASSDGKTMNKDELEKLGLGDTKGVEKLKSDMEKLAQGQFWKLDVVDTPQGRKYRAIIGDEEEEEETGGKVKPKEAKEAKDTKETRERRKPDEGRKKKEEGSEEEFYKEEL